MSYEASIWLVWAAFMAAMVWFMVCNNRTLAQRKRMIDERLRKYINDDDDDVFWHNSSELRRVRYGSHLWRLFFFRDPEALYQFRAPAATPKHEKIEEDA